VSCCAPSVLHLNYWHAAVTLIQRVSCCVPPVLHLNCWHTTITFLPASELLYSTWSLFELVTYCYEIPSSLWVAVCIMGFFWISDMPLWNPIQLVSCWVPHGLYLNCWPVIMKFHSVGGLLCAFWGPFELLTCHHEILPGSELLCGSWASFELLTCWYEISSRMWVAVYLLGFIRIANMLPWNSIQLVSCCVPPMLHLNCWHSAIKSHTECGFLCTFWAPFNYWPLVIKSLSGSELL